MKNIKTTVNGSHINGLKMPSIFNTLFGVFVIIFRKKTKNDLVTLPQQIGPYTLSSLIEKKDNSDKVAIGIYTSGGKRFLIKRWSGDAKDISYYTLVNEYVVNNILSRKTPVKDSSIKFPKSVEYFEDAVSFSAVFEFIDGRLLSEYSLEKQAEVIEDVLNFFNKVSATLSIDEQKFFIRRSFAYYLLLLPVIIFLSIIMDIKNTKIILKTFYLILLSAKNVDGRTLLLAHRDITPDNVMLTDR